MCMLTTNRGFINIFSSMATDFYRGVGGGGVGTKLFTKYKNVPLDAQTRHNRHNHPHSWSIVLLSSLH